MNGIKAVINSFIFKNDSQSCSKSKLNKVVSLAIATISLVGAALAACPKQVFDSLVTIISNISSTIRNVVAKSKQIILGDCSVPANTVKEAAHAGTAMSEIQSPKNTVQVPESSPSFMFNQDNYSWSNISNISKSTIRNVVAKSKQIILEDCSVPANTVSIALPTEIENTDSYTCCYRSK